MPLGSIVHTDNPEFNIIYRKLAAAQTAAPGKPVSFDSSGDIVIADNTKDGPFGALIAGKDASTPMFVSIGGTNYYAVLMAGDIVMTMGGAVPPNSWVTIGSSANKLIQLAKQSISGTYMQAEIQALQNENWRKYGTYLRLEADSEHAAVAAADTNLGVIRLAGK